jgi:hypothetical protein
MSETKSGACSVAKTLIFSCSHMLIHNETVLSEDGDASLNELDAFSLQAGGCALQT